MATEKQKRETQLRAAAELRRVPRVVSEEKVLLWRKKELIRLGFSMGEAQSLSVRGEADLHEIERWLGEGATHVQVLAILARAVEVVSQEWDDAA